jgi:hypothetical protein
MLIAVDGTVAFHAADCAWFQPAASPLAWWTCFGRD